jgi:hypothetical protein
MISRGNSDYHDFALRPISWDHTVPRDVRPIKPGFAGYLPNASSHFGSTHYGSLPIRGGGRAALPHQGRQNRAEVGATQLMAGGAMGKDAELHMMSSHEIGRNAWNLEWAGHARPKPQTPASSHRRQEAPDSSRRPHSASVGAPSGGLSQRGAAWTVGRRSQRVQTPPESPLPSYRKVNYVPMSRDPRGPLAAHAHAVGGIRPGYMGHIPRVLNHYGSTHVGGSYERQDTSLPGGVRSRQYTEGEVAGGSDAYSQEHLDRWLREKGTAGDFRHALSA